MRIEPARCLRALRSRDARFDGRFFVGVRTTGIYCRPVCPAREARVENLGWFACAAAAEQAGYRPCKRCRPETAPGSPAWAGTSATVERALRLIAAGALDDGDAHALAARLGVGDRHLRRLFAKHVGASPASVAQTRRAHFARKLIDETSLPMGALALAAGFKSLRQFNDAIRTRFGAAPSALRRQARPQPRAGGLELRLPLRPPFDFAFLLDYWRARAIPGVESCADGRYRRTLRLAAGKTTLELWLDPAGACVRLKLGASGGPGLVGLVERVRRLLDLDADTQAIARCLRSDAGLRALLPAAGRLRVPGAWDPFELAVRAVLGQQVSVAAASTLAGRLVARLGEPFETHLPGLTHAFPTPETLAGADLDGVGLTRARAATLRALGAALCDGRLRLDGSAPLEETLGALQSLPGIGAWTAQYVALRALGDPDAFPAGDLGLRRALGVADERALLRRAEAWRPWRGYAAIALWSRDHAARPVPNADSRALAEAR